MKRDRKKHPRKGRKRWEGKREVEIHYDFGGHSIQYSSVFHLYSTGWAAIRRNLYGESVTIATKPLEFSNYVKRTDEDKVPYLLALLGIPDFEKVKDVVIEKPGDYAAAIMLVDEMFNGAYYKTLGYRSTWTADPVYLSYELTIIIRKIQLYESRYIVNSDQMILLKASTDYWTTEKYVEDYINRITVRPMIVDTSFTKPKPHHKAINTKIQTRAKKFSTKGFR